MIELVDSTNVGLFGPVCSGKTFLLKTWLKSQNRYVRFDYTGETMKENADVEHYYKPLALLERLEAKPYFFQIAYHPGVNVMEHYKWCQKAVWMLDAPRWIAIDEYHRICPQRTNIDEDVETSLRLARHNKLGIIGASQRPQDVHKLFVDSCRMVIVYRSQEENYLNACAGHWGSDAAEAIERLRPLIHNDVTNITKQVPQCLVVMRDGTPPRVYDFKTDKYILLSNFLEGGEEDGDKSEPFHTDLDEEGAQSNGVPDAAGNSDTGEHSV